MLVLLKDLLVACDELRMVLVDELLRGLERLRADDRLAARKEHRHTLRRSEGPAPNAEPEHERHVKGNREALEEAKRVGDHRPKARVAKGIHGHERPRRSAARS